MMRGVRWFFVGSVVLVALSGCGRGLFQTAEREAWRAEAERACLKSGAVRETADLVRIDPISGPGVCGAEFPLRVAALGELNQSFGFTDERGSSVARNQTRLPSAIRNARAAAPMSLNAPGIESDDDIGAMLNADARRDLSVQNLQPLSGPQSYPAQNYPQPYATRGAPPQQTPLPRLGPSGGGSQIAAFGPVVMRPTATLACPMVSALDRWLADSVQPAAMRWFGMRVTEIKQISAYSCRGMNGSSRAHISEHAFGNALDIASFVLADGRRVTVKDGWRGMPEEQGFLRDVQGAACQQFNTVLAPGSNVYHYDHIHVDLMRRSSRRVICQPAAVSGEEIAARATPRGYASRDAGITGSIGKFFSRNKKKPRDEDDYEDQ